MDCDVWWVLFVVWFGDYSCLFYVKLNVSMFFGFVRFMGIGSLKEGN